MTGEAEILSVTGGSHGLAAAYEQVRALADTYDAAGDRMREWATTGGRTLADADLLESALLSPRTFAEAETAVLAATTGPHGVLVKSVAWESDAVLARVTLAALAESDDVVRATFEVLDYTLGRALGFTLTVTAPGLLVGAAVLGPAAWSLHQLLPPHLQQQLQAGAEDAGEGFEAWLSDHPEAVQHLVNGGGGLLDGLWDGLTPLTPGGPFGVPSFTPDTESAAAVLALLYGDDGTGVAVATDFAVPASGHQPSGLADVLEHLDQLHGAGANGTIEVQTITGPDGQVRHIVYLPGTDDLATLPWTQDGDVRDMHTNFLLVGGADTAYQQGILDAMAQAGVAADDPVLLAGHSQGGMEAVAILGNGSPFSVTNVVTAGSPTAQVDGFPPGSHVLSLEHRGDVVPLLDGEENADSPQQTTVHFDAGGAGIADHHEIAHYTAAAQQLESSNHPSVVDNLASMQQHGYLVPAGADGWSVESQSFQVVREP